VEAQRLLQPAAYHKFFENLSEQEGAGTHLVNCFALNAGNVRPTMNKVP
jgi:hypothetical protein